MNIAILGFADQGISAYEYWNRPGNEITICDSRQDIEIPLGASAQLGVNYLQNLDQFDLIVRGAPSIHPRDIVAVNSEMILNKVTSATNEFINVCPSKNIIGVTGTKGKGTTSTLIAKMLEADGKTVHLGGNIGIPPLDMLKANIQPDDWVVLELANFQLIDLKYSPHIAMCLMVVPEHMDWHKDMDEYITAKQQLFKWQKPEDIAIYFGPDNNSQMVTHVSQGQKIPYYMQPGAVVEGSEIKINNQTICRTDELKLLGDHNWQNACAAVTATWQITQNVEAMWSVLTTFAGLEHRLEFVREVGNVEYYNDSFGTVPETAIVAIKSFNQPKVVILGGSDKGANYDDLAKTIASSNVRKVVLIGLMAGRIQEALEKAGFHEFVPGGNTMSEIVNTARAQAQPGDVVLLSTACASFDMFKNYKDRGEQFKQAVSELA